MRWFADVSTDRTAWRGEELQYIWGNHQWGKSFQYTAILDLPLPVNGRHSCASTGSWSDPFHRVYRIHYINIFRIMSLTCLRTFIKDLYNITGKIVYIDKSIIVENLANKKFLLSTYLTIWQASLSLHTCPRYQVITIDRYLVETTWEKQKHSNSVIFLLNVLINQWKKTCLVNTELINVINPVIWYPAYI